MRRALGSGLLLAGVLVGCAVVACSSVKARLEPRQALWDDAGRHVYTRPLEQVWPEVERFLSERGISGRKVEGEYTLLTEYEEFFHESRVASGFVRYYVDARALSPVSCEVRILRHVMFTGGKGKPSAAEQVNPERLVRRTHAPPSHWDNQAPDTAEQHFARHFNRDLQLEWALLQRLDPEAARALAARHGPAAREPAPPGPDEQTAQTALAAADGEREAEQALRGRLETLGSVMDALPPGAASTAGLERAQCNRSNPWLCHYVAYAYEGDRNHAGGRKPKDLGVAAALHEFACLHRHWGACARLGVFYAQGKGVPRSDAKAAVLYQLACEHDSIGGACQNLGWQYALGVGVPRDDARADHYFRRACDEGVKEGCRNARKLETYRAEEQHLRKVLAANRAFAVLPPGTAGEVGALLQQCTRETRWRCNNWGAGYSDGKERAAQPPVAAALFEQACALGEATACQNLSRLVLAEGRALHSSLLQPYLSEGCERGEAAACTAAGLRVLREPERKGAHAQALRLFGRACELQDAVGCSNLGWMHERGEGTPADAAQAARLYTRACEAGVAVACRNLAVLHARGRGVPQDWALAAQAYGRACDGGDGQACFNLASLHAAGHGVEKDRARSATLYESACVAGQALACVNLGFMYQAGLGVAADAGRAAQLYERACFAGHAQACGFAANLLETVAGLDASRAGPLYARGCELGSAEACAPRR